MIMFNANFNNISVIFREVVSFIGGGNRRKSLTCRKSLTTLLHNVVSSTPRHERDSNRQL